jgi:hypothetical protein
MRIPHPAHAGSNLLILLTPNVLRVIAIFCAFSGYCLAEPAYEHFITGRQEDVSTRPQPGILLAGGGGDIDAAFKCF